MATHFSIPAWESHRQRSLAGYSMKCCKESDRTLSLSKHCNSNQGHLEMASKKVTEFVILCAPLTLICIHRDNVLLFPFIAQMIGPIISAVGNLIPCFYFLVLCFVLILSILLFSVSHFLSLWIQEKDGQSDFVVYKWKPKHAFRPWCNALKNNTQDIK